MFYLLCNILLTLIFFLAVSSTPKPFTMSKIKAKPVLNDAITTLAPLTSSNTKEIIENSVKPVKNHLSIHSVETSPIVPKIEIIERTFKRRTSRIPNLSLVSKDASINSNEITSNMNKSIDPFINVKKNAPSMDKNNMKDFTAIENQGIKAMDLRIEKDFNVIIKHPCSEKELCSSGNHDNMDKHLQGNIRNDTLSEGKILRIMLEL